MYSASIFTPTCFLVKAGKFAPFAESTVARRKPGLPLDGVIADNGLGVRGWELADE